MHDRVNPYLRAKKGEMWSGPKALFFTEFTLVAMKQNICEINNMLPVIERK